MNGIESQSFLFVDNHNCDKSVALAPHIIQFIPGMHSILACATVVALKSVPLASRQCSESLTFGTASSSRLAAPLRKVTRDMKIRKLPILSARRPANGGPVECENSFKCKSISKRY